MTPASRLLIILSKDKTLYHGTLVENIPNILKYGLEPGVGKFTKGFYDEIANIEKLPELIFAADKQGLKSCISAIIGHLRVKGIEINETNFLSMQH